MVDKQIIECANLLQKVIDTKADEKAIKRYVKAAKKAGVSQKAIDNIVNEAKELACNSKMS